MNPGKVRAYCDHCHVITVFEPARTGWTACTWCGHLRPQRRRPAPAHPDP